MTIKKAIVLLYPPYNHNPDEIILSLQIRCKENDLEIIDTILFEDQFDSVQARGLIQRINNAEKGITLITNRSIFFSTSNIIIWTIPISNHVARAGK